MDNRIDTVVSNILERYKPSQIDTLRREKESLRKEALAGMASYYKLSAAGENARAQSTLKRAYEASSDMYATSAAIAMLAGESDDAKCFWGLASRFAKRSTIVKRDLEKALVEQ